MANAAWLPEMPDIDDDVESLYYDNWYRYNNDRTDYNVETHGGHYYLCFRVADPPRCPCEYVPTQCCLHRQAWRRACAADVRAEHQRRAEAKAAAARKAAAAKNHSLSLVAPGAAGSLSVTDCDPDRAARTARALTTAAPISLVGFLKWTVPAGAMGVYLLAAMTWLPGWVGTLAFVVYLVFTYIALR